MASMSFGSVLDFHLMHPEAKQTENHLTKIFSVNVLDTNCER